jgi:hypothetical protein
MKKKGVLTEYNVGDKKYCSYVLGGNLKSINKKIKERGLNEKIISTIQPVELIPDFENLSDYEFFLKLPTILHTACFLSFISINSNKNTLPEILGDEGVVHEMTHILAGVTQPSRGSLRLIRAKFSKLRGQAIGLY